MTGRKRGGRCVRNEGLSKLSLAQRRTQGLSDHPIVDLHARLSAGIKVQFCLCIFQALSHTSLPQLQPEACTCCCWYPIVCQKHHSKSSGAESLFWANWFAAEHSMNGPGRSCKLEKEWRFWSERISVEHRWRYLQRQIYMYICVLLPEPTPSVALESYNCGKVSWEGSWLSYKCLCSSCRNDVSIIALS